MLHFPQSLQDWTVLLFGTWLLLSPLFLQTGAGAAWNARVVGLAFVLFATLALIDPRMWEEWLNLIVAAWLIVSPFVLGFGDDEPAAWNAVLTGLAVGGIALRIVTGNSARRAGIGPAHMKGTTF